MPDAPGLELIAAEINEASPDAVIETSHAHGMATLVIRPEPVLDVLQWLKETPGQEYGFCAAVYGVDYLPETPRFGVHYQLLNMPRVERICVKALLEDPAMTRDVGNSIPAADGSRPPEPESSDEDSGGPDLLPAIDSCVGLFPTADFQEREVYDFFGIAFKGHPDLRRILMPEDYVGWPQRRDFPMGGEPVTFTRTENELRGGSR